MGWDENVTETDCCVENCVSKAEPAIEVRPVEPQELARFESLLKEGHYLGPAPPVGDFLRQVALRNGQWVGLLVWGPAAYKPRTGSAGLAGACPSGSSGSSWWSRTGAFCS
jgi:hypothetical protein